MKNLFLLILLMALTACSLHNKPKDNFVLAFGSCNNQELENTLWNEVEKHKPDVWVWGGDIIYSDTNDMSVLQKNYQIQKQIPGYKHLVSTTDVIGTWDDHDYGINDGGKEYPKKAESQQLFLDFLDVPKNDKRRNQEGIYSDKDYTIGEHKLKIIILDTRYFRTELSIDSDTDNRFKPNEHNNGSMLGEQQWQWLDDLLHSSEADFNIIISSIQFLSSEHGFEKWGNMPNEVNRMEQLISSSKAKNVVFLSGDRHISEISSKQIDSMNYPLIDFTSSGLTHSYGSLKVEENQYRVGELVVDKSFGVLYFDFDKQQIEFEIRGENNKLIQQYIQKY
jgi:alkaline phosphatase D